MHLLKEYKLTPPVPTHKVQAIITTLRNSPKE